MKKTALVVLIVLFLALLLGCSYTTPLTATSNDVGIKMGESSISYLFGFIPLSTDAGIWAAARNGGIKKIATVDLKVSYWVIGVSYTTVISGE